MESFFAGEVNGPVLIFSVKYQTAGVSFWINPDIIKENFKTKKQVI
jgi:hypothetical protein